MYNLTTEQEACVQASTTEKNIKTKAFAGSGKISLRFSPINKIKNRKIK